MRGQYFLIEDYQGKVLIEVEGFQLIKPPNINYLV